MSFDSDAQGEGAVAFDPATLGLRSFEQRQREEAPPAPEQSALPASPYAAGKRVLDVMGTIVLATVFSPLILLIAILMRQEGGSIIYKHRRIGRDGRAFECLKFRTMVPNADQVLRELLERDPAIKAEWVRDHKLRSDPRVTRLGRFLRRTSLDELPQLWNVLVGQMSLVGPRPPLWYEVQQYKPWHRHRVLEAKPGITGLWQVTGRSRTTFDEMVRLDLRYARGRSLWADIKILLATPAAVFKGKGAC